MAQEFKRKNAPQYKDGGGYAKHQMVSPIFGVSNTPVLGVSQTPIMGSASQPWWQSMFRALPANTRSAIRTLSGRGAGSGTRGGGTPTQNVMRLGIETGQVGPVSETYRETNMPYFDMIRFLAKSTYGREELTPEEWDRMLGVNADKVGFLGDYSRMIKRLDYFDEEKGYEIPTLEKDIILTFDDDGTGYYVPYDEKIIQGDAEARKQGIQNAFGGLENPYLNRAFENQNIPIYGLDEFYPEDKRYLVYNSALNRVEVMGEGLANPIKSLSMKRFQELYPQLDTSGVQSSGVDVRINIPEEGVTIGEMSGGIKIRQEGGLTLAKDGKKMKKGYTRKQDNTGATGATDATVTNDGAVTPGGSVNTTTTSSTTTPVMGAGPQQSTFIGDPNQQPYLTKREARQARKDLRLSNRTGVPINLFGNFLDMPMGDPSTIARMAGLSGRPGMYGRLGASIGGNVLQGLLAGAQRTGGGRFGGFFMPQGTLNQMAQNYTGMGMGMGDGINAQVLGPRQRRRLERRGVDLVPLPQYVTEGFERGRVEPIEAVEPGTLQATSAGQVAGEQGEAMAAGQAAASTGATTSTTTPQMFEIAPGRTTTSRINPETADVDRLAFAAGYGVRPGRARREMMEDANIGRGDIRLERQTTPFGATRQEAIDNLLREYFIEQVQPTLNPDAFIQNNMHGGTIIGGTPTSQYGVTLNPLNNYAGSFMNSALGAAGSYANGGYTRNQDVPDTKTLGDDMSAVNAAKRLYYDMLAGEGAQSDQAGQALRMMFSPVSGLAEVIASAIYPLLSEEQQKKDDAAKGRQAQATQDLEEYKQSLKEQGKYKTPFETVKGFFGLEQNGGYSRNMDSYTEYAAKTSNPIPESVFNARGKAMGNMNVARAGMVIPPPPSPTRIGMRMAQEGIQTPIDYSSSDASLMGYEQMMANAFNNSMMAGNNIPNGGMMMAADGMMKEDMEVNNAIEQYRNEMYLRNGGAVVRSRDAYSPAIPMGSGMGPSNLSQSLVDTAMGPDLTQEQIDVLNMVVGEEPMVMPGNSEVVQGKFGPIHSPTPEYLMRTNRMA